MTTRYRPRTFDAARQGILAALRSAGWAVKDALKVPHATSPDGDFRLWFKPQAVACTEGPRHDFGDARCFGGYGLDIRQCDGEAFLRLVEALRKG